MSTTKKKQPTTPPPPEATPEIPPETLPESLFDEEEKQEAEPTFPQAPGEPPPAGEPEPEKTIPAPTAAPATPHYEYITDTSGGSNGLLLDPWATVTVKANAAASSAAAPGSPAAPAPGGSFVARLRRSPRTLAYAGIAFVLALALTGGAVAFAFGGRMAGPTAPVVPAATRAALHTAPSPSPVRPTPAAATPTLAAAATQQERPTATAIPQSAFLLHDTFQRTVAAGWGTASSGQPWVIVPQTTLQDFSVSSGMGGQIAGFFDAATFYTATLGPVAGQETGEMDVSLLGFTSDQQTNVGVVLRWQDRADYYKAYIDGANLILMKNVAGQQVALASVPFPAQDGTVYRLRFSAVGMTLLAKVWVASAPEPVAWMVAAHDTSLRSGTTGVRMLLLPGDLVNVTAFTCQVAA